MRCKWFAPARDGEPCSPFGLAGEGAATLYGDRSGCNVGLGRADQGAEDLAQRNRDFWMAADRVTTTTKPALRRLLQVRLKGRSA